MDSLELLEKILKKVSPLMRYDHTWFPILQEINLFGSAQYDAGYVEGQENYECDLYHCDADHEEIRERAYLEGFDEGRIEGEHNARND